MYGRPEQSINSVVADAILESYGLDNEQTLSEKDWEKHCNRYHPDGITSHSQCKYLESAKESANQANTEHTNQEKSIELEIEELEDKYNKEFNVTPIHVGNSNAIQDIGFPSHIEEYLLSGEPITRRQYHEVLKAVYEECNNIKRKFPKFQIAYDFICPYNNLAQGKIGNSSLDRRGYVGYLMLVDEESIRKKLTDISHADYRRIVRHELGHTLSTHKIKYLFDKEFHEVVLKKYKEPVVRQILKAVCHQGDIVLDTTAKGEQAQRTEEVIADLFALYTADEYRNGLLPPELELVVETMLNDNNIPTQQEVLAMDEKNTKVKRPIFIRNSMESSALHNMPKKEPGKFYALNEIHDRWECFNSAQERDRFLEEHEKEIARISSTPEEVKAWYDQEMPRMLAAIKKINMRWREKSFNALAADAILEAMGISQNDGRTMEGASVSEINNTPDHDRLPNEFEAPIKGFSMTRAQMEDYLRKALEENLKEMGLELRDMALRGGQETEIVDGTNSNGRFLELCFEYDDLGRGIYEDEVQKYLDKYHPVAFEGVRVALRPFNAKQSGTIEDYVKNYEGRHQQASAGADVGGENDEMQEVPKPPAPKADDPTHNLDYQSKIEIDVKQDLAPKNDRPKYGTSQGVPFSRDEISQIAAALGTTNDLKEGGWILPDGRLVRFYRDGIRRDERDIGIGFTEERKSRISNEIESLKGKILGKDNSEERTGPVDLNGTPQSQPVDPTETVAEKTYPEAFPLEAVRGGLIRYALSRDGDAVEIDVYNVPTQGQYDVLEDIHEWVKFVNDGGYDKGKTNTPDGNRAQAMGANAGQASTPPEAPSQPPMQAPAQTPAANAQDAMSEQDAFEKDVQKGIDKVDEQLAKKNERFMASADPIGSEDIPSSRMVIVYVGENDDDWWDYAEVDDVQRNLVKDIRSYFRDGKKPNEDFRIPEEEYEEIEEYNGQAVGEDESVGWLKGRNADIFPKRVYRPRKTLLEQVDYQTARRIIRENLALIRTIPMLDILEAEKKILGYFRRKISRDQLARYFYRQADGLITKAWSEVIADDQINKVSERLRVEKWRKNGVRMVRWVHSNMSEPRPYHKTVWNNASGIFDGRPNGLNGFVFPIDHPPVIDPVTGERGYPGQLINCKCHLEPVR